METVQPNTVTENGAKSNSTTGSAVLDLFFKTVRNTPVESLTAMLSSSWNESPLDTLKVIFHLRDCRGGKGERKQFHECLKWLCNAGHTVHVVANIPHIAFYGTFKDLFALCETPAELPMLKFYADQLSKDIDTFNNAMSADGAKTLANGNKHTNVSVSLAAKWAPSVGSSLDKKYHLAAKLLGLLKGPSKPTTVEVFSNNADYRKKLLVPLRKHLDIVETHMCQGDWENINFSTVPSVAMKLYREAFADHQEVRFHKYLEDVKSGKAKINSAMVYPHQLAEHYLHFPYKEDTVIEEQWKSIVRDTKTKFAGAGSSALAIIDVSGSMSGTPLQVAIALGLLLAEVASGPFSGKVITFSESPNLFCLDLEKSLRDKVESLKTMSWDMNTNLIKAFDLILNTAKMFNVPAENMPKTLYIFSDMQFDQACPQNLATNFEVIEQKYRQAGYTRPNIVYWNLRGDTVDFPVEKHVPKTALVSGFSQSLLQLFIDGKVISPYAIMRDAIDAPRYSKITLGNN